MNDFLFVVGEDGVGDDLYGGRIPDWFGNCKVGEAYPYADCGGDVHVFVLRIRDLLGYTPYTMVVWLVGVGILYWSVDGVSGPYLGDVCWVGIQPMNDVATAWSLRVPVLEIIVHFWV